MGKITETLKTVRENLLKNIALELAGDDPYQFCRNYTAGYVEFIIMLLVIHVLIYFDIEIDITHVDLSLSKVIVNILILVLKSKPAGLGSN